MRGFRERRLTPPPFELFFSGDNKLNSREDHISRHWKLSKSNHLLSRTEPNLVLVVNTYFRDVPCGMSPAALVPCSFSAATVARFHLNA